MPRFPARTFSDHPNHTPTRGVGSQIRDPSRCISRFRVALMSDKPGTVLPRHTLATSVCGSYDLWPLTLHVLLLTRQAVGCAQTRRVRGALILSRG